MGVTGRPAPPPFPVKSVQFAAQIGGAHTEFILQSFDDSYFFIITQIGKIGTMVRHLLVGVNYLFMLYWIKIEY
jgi:hypothetical protein